MRRRQPQAKACDRRHHGNSLSLARARLKQTALHCRPPCSPCLRRFSGPSLPGPLDPRLPPSWRTSSTAAAALEPARRSGPMGSGRRGRIRPLPLRRRLPGSLDCCCRGARGAWPAGRLLVPSASRSPAFLLQAPAAEARTPLPLLRASERPSSPRRPCKTAIPLRDFPERSRCCRCSRRLRSGGSTPESRALGSTRLTTRDTMAPARIPYSLSMLWTVTPHRTLNPPPPFSRRRSASALVSLTSIQMPPELTLYSPRLVAELHTASPPPSRMATLYVAVGRRPARDEAAAVVRHEPEHDGGAAARRVMGGSR